MTESSARTRTIKVSEEEYELLQKARKALAKKGYDRLNLEDIAKKETSSELDELLLGLGLGAIAGAGALAIMALLFGGGDQ